MSGVHRQALGYRPMRQVMGEVLEEVPSLGSASDFKRQGLGCEDVQVDFEHDAELDFEEGYADSGKAA